MISLSPQMKKMFLDELNYSIEKMEKTPDPIQKLFYFSATYGVIQRLFNLEYSQDLVFAHFILSEAYKAFASRLRVYKDNQDTTIPVLVEQIERLISLTKEFAKKIESNKELTDTLKKFVVLAYSTTGNGFYLYEKGVLKI
jgi:hypothetical protein